MRTWREIIALTSAYLAQKGIDDAQVAAELLAARLLKCGRGYLAPHLERTVPEPFLAAMRRAMTRLVNGEPIQYVLGEWDFRRLTLKCDARALIPRPETEELVTRVLASQQVRRPHPLIVDVGTGTGCIILSLAKELQNDARFVGIDVSADAVELAKENAQRCGLADKVNFVVADGLDDFDEPNIIDVIVSNPPYIAHDVCATLPRHIREHEPMLALDGGESGLDFYERYIGDALNLLSPGGAIFFEIGDDQGEAVRNLLTEAGFTNIVIAPDFAGHPRYASGTLE